MKLSYTQKKRLKSLATRYLHQYDSLVEIKDMSQHYLSDFNSFMEDMLVDLCGYKREDKPEVHRPRKVGERPPKRKPGERPPRNGEKIKPPKGKMVASKDSQKTIPEISIPKDSNKPSWYKKVWRKVMIAIHPDKLDAVSSDELDKLERIKIANRVRLDESPHLLVASSNMLGLDIEVSSYEQERIMRVASQKMQQEIAGLQQGIPWAWGESFVDTSLRVKIIKLVMENSGLTSPPDNKILEYMTRKENEND